MRVVYAIILTVSFMVVLYINAEQARTIQQQRTLIHQMTQDPACMNAPR